MKVKLSASGLYILLSCIFIAVGVSVFMVGFSRPVYSIQDAPRIVEERLEGLPYEYRRSRYGADLAIYDTGHRKYTDWGRGLISVGIGFLLSLRLTHLMRCADEAGRVGLLRRYFRMLWEIKIPLLIWYYFLRLVRRDYPSYADSVMPLIIIAVFMTFIGYVLFSQAMNSALKNHTLPGDVSIREIVRKISLRHFLVLLWGVFLLYRISSGIVAGDESAIISNVATIPILLLLLSSTRNTDKLPDSRQA